MDIPTDILEELKCLKCDMYLSRGPIYLQHDGAAACGRCVSPKRPATRNTLYETVAKLLKFPCKNRDLGCKEMVSFAGEEQEVAHETTCKYRQYVCPVLGSAHCDWLGTRSQILEHCQAQHPDRVLNNPCSLAHDITTSSLHNFIIKAFQFLFLLHTKVCVTSGKLYHSVRLLDSSALAKDFIYKLYIRRNEEEVTKKGAVAPQGCLVIQEPTALVLDTNSLLSVLGGWTGATFTLTLEQRGPGIQQKQETETAKQQKKETEAAKQWKQEPEAAKQQKQESAAAKQQKVTAEVERQKREQQKQKQGTVKVEQRMQNMCDPNIQTCTNQSKGCTYQDIPDKCYKHERYFCDQSTFCSICRYNIPFQLSMHYNYQHNMCKSGTTWQMTRSYYWQKCLVSSPVGTAMCLYWLNYSRLHLQVAIPEMSGRLAEFKCVLRVMHPVTRFIRTYTPEVTYNDSCDWRIVINRQDVRHWSSVFSISVDILKIRM